MKKTSIYIAAAVVLILIAIGLYWQEKIKPDSRMTSVKLAQNQNANLLRSTDQMWGDPAKTMFPAINSPAYVPVGPDTAYLKDEDDVYYLKADGKTYVYPAMILGFHHLVNDTMDGKPVLISTCLLSNTSIAYSRETGGKTLEFGVLGPLYYGNLVMYDEETDSYWIQLTGEVIKGENKDAQLDYLSALQESSWGDVKTLSDVQVLVAPREESFYRRWYEKMKGSQIGLNSLDSKIKVDERRDPFEKGIGIALQNGTHLYYPVEILNTNSAFQDSISGATVSVAKDPITNAWNVTINGKPARWNTVYWYSWAALYPDTQIRDVI